ncbi:MAG: DUF692 family protein [Gammaproteobacteria bacterium]|nr:DUF692 family protein [Gammaproteobacteria bacterium]
MKGEINGVGVGLRSPHVAEIAAGRRDVGWLEILADNYLAEGGRCHRDLERVRENHACTFHCVGMSVGSADELNDDYLGQIKALADRYQPAWVSDHLCFVSARGEYQHDLLPLPRTEEAVRHAAERIGRIQERLRRRILIENISCYLEFEHSAMSEAEFVNAVCERADCGLLLDINNLYVNQVNLGADARDFLATVNTGRVHEIHLAGVEKKRGFVIDAHNHPVSNEVWDLYASFIEKNPQIPTLIEWDFDVPDLDTLVAEAHKAEARYPKPAARTPRANTAPGADTTPRANAAPRTGAAPRATGAAPRTDAAARGNGHNGGNNSERGPQITTLQNRFLRALNDDGGALRPHVRAAPHLPFGTQISIHRSNANNARIHALEESHPVCVKILGERYFRQVAKAFIRAHPSRHPDLNRYGKELSPFISELAQTRPELQDFAYLPDLAQLEYLHHRCYYRRNDVRADRARLERADAAGRAPRVFLNHTVALMSSVFPVAEIWRAHRRDNPPAVFEQPPQPVRICIYREGTRPRVEEIGEHDHRILQRAARAPALDELVGELHDDGLAGGAISRAIPALVAKNWLVVDAGA